MRGVLYMLAGSRRAAQLTVSLYSLRQHWDGEVHILAHDDAGESVAKRLASDPRLNVSYSRWFPEKSGRGKGHHQSLKPMMGHFSPFDQTVFLDTDTLVAGSFEELWPLPGEVRLTRFSTWVSTGTKMRGRIRGWLDVCPDLVERQLGEGYPALNTGILSFCKSASFLPAWNELTEKHPVFMCDEIAAQLIFVDHPHQVMDHRFNFSPLFSLGEGLPVWEKSDARIVHFHGWGHCRPHKSAFGHQLWIPEYERACAANIGGIGEWGPGDDKHLRKYLDLTPST